MGSRKREPARRQTPSSFFAYLPHAFALLAIVAAIAHFRTQIDSNDEGIATMGAWRVLRGEVPYRDFFAIETPLSFYLVAPLYKLFGTTFEVGRVVTQLLGIALVVFVFRLARRWIPTPLFAAIPLAFLCQAGVGLLPFANHHWFADVFCLASLAAAERALSDDRVLWWPLAGAAAALAFESLQDQGILILVGLGLVAAFAPRQQLRLRSLTRFAAGAAAAGLPLALIVLPRSGFGPAWHDLVVFPLTAYRQTTGNAYGFFQPFGEILSQWTSGAWRHAQFFTAAASITSLALIATPIAAVPLIVWTWRRRNGSKTAAVLLLVGVIDFVLTACHRWAPINLQWAAAPPALALGWWLHHEHEASPKGRRMTTLVAIVLLLAFGLFAIGRIGQAMEPRIWFDVVSPAGRTRIPSRGAGQLVQEMITAVGQQVPAHESLLVYAWPTWAFATLHPCPVRWDGFAPPDFPPGKYTQPAIAEVEDKKIPWIVTPAFDPPAPGQVDPWKDYIGSHYQVVWANQSWGLWKRSGG